MLSQQHDDRYTARFFDDFSELNTSRFASTDDGATGTNAIAAKIGGWMNVVTAGAANDYHAMGSQKIVEFLAGKPVTWEIRLACTEANTNQANIAVGLSDLVTTGFMQDANAGPLASYHGAVFYKTGGTSVWGFETANGTTKTTNASLGAFVSGANTTLAVQFNPNDGVTGIFTPYLNGVAGTPHRVALSGLTAALEFFAVKAGSTSAETVSVDYVGLEVYR
jgi:hypothetical protein